MIHGAFPVDETKTTVLLNFIRDLRYEEVPEKTRRRVSDSLLDIIGIAAAALDTDAAVRLRSYAAKHHPPTGLSCRMLFDSRRVHPLGAGWVGGFTVDSLDAHEGHFSSKGHAGATVVPALFALVDAYHEGGRKLEGKEFLTTLTIGYEFALRAGAALVASAPDYHASGAFSGLGVVAMGVRLLALESSCASHAFGIAEYLGPRCPMMRLIDHPSMLRDAHGAGAHAGLNALLLAQEGITGAPAATLGERGVARHWVDLGSRWEIDQQYYKPWPVCRWAQPALQAMSDLMTQHSIDATAVQRIEVETFHESMRLQGHTPTNAEEAQYGLAFPLAALVVRGRLGPEEVTGNAIFDQDILRLSRNITLIDAPDLSARFPQEILSRLRIYLNDGSVIASPVTKAKGDPDAPMTAAELRAKYETLAGTRLAPSQIQAIAEATANLADAPSCGELLNLVLETPAATSGLQAVS